MHNLKNKTKYFVSLLLRGFKLLVVLGFLGLVVLVLYFAGLIDISHSAPDNMVLRKAITQSIGVIKNHSLSDSLTINMVRLTTFKWDTLYVFRGTNSKNFISQAIGTPWNNGSPNGWLDANPDNLLVFMNRGKIVSYVWYQGVAGGNEPAPDFIHFQMQVNSAELFTPTTAEFTVVRQKFPPCFIQLYNKGNVESIYRPGFNPRNVSNVD